MIFKRCVQEEGVKFCLDIFLAKSSEGNANSEDQLLHSGASKTRKYSLARRTRLKKFSTLILLNYLSNKMLQ